MRPALLLALSVLVLSVSVPLGLAAATTAGTLAVEDGVGTVTVRGQGTLVARMDRGDVLVQDLTPLDQWSPRLNGVPRGKLSSLRGHDVNIFVPGGRYRIVLRGDGISLSARGTGTAQLRARPGARFDVGRYAVGDGPFSPLPDDLVRVSFGSDQETP